MAKRRKLETPSAETLGKIEDEFRRETPSRSRSAPIAQVAAEAAGQFQVGTPEMRRDEAQAAAYRVAEGQGRLIKEIALQEIDATSMQRDRTVVDAEALEELEFSIAEHGLRLPVEVYALAAPKDGKRFGLLSGYRRLIAQQNLHARRGDDAYATIKAVLRNPDEMGGAFVAMVEENEIRADLSHFERGRIAAIAAQQGAFSSTENAVAQMFAAASKAKRSKIRSFALIFEELGDVLRFPETLREKDGLRLAQALKGGFAAKLRDGLAAGQGADASDEWALINRVLNEINAPGTTPKRGGRPTTTHAQWQGQRMQTARGITLQSERDKGDFLIRFSGAGLEEDMLNAIMREVFEKLEKSEPHKN